MYQAVITAVCLLVACGDNLVGRAGTRPGPVG